MTEEQRYAGRTVLVTGASGIVGSWLVRSLLGAGATVVALVRDDDPHSEFVRSGDVTRVTRVHGSLEDLVLLERTIVQYEVHVVFHLGAQTQVRHAQWSPWASLEANVRGTYNLLEACRRNPRTLEAVVIASSDKAYGETDVLPYTEAHPLAGRNIYDASKSAADLLASAYAHSYGLPLGIARCANIYGGGRPQLGSHRAGDDPVASASRGTGRSAATAPCCATTCTWMTPWAPTSSLVPHSWRAVSTPRPSTSDTGPRCRSSRS